MSFISTLVKGLGWGLGLGLGFLITSIAYQYYEDHRIGGFVERIDSAYPQEIAVAEADIKRLEVALVKKAVMNGSVLISGELKNTLDRPLKFAGVNAAVGYQDVVIERCFGLADGPIPPGEVGDVSIICEKDWSNLDQTELEVSLRVTTAHYHDA